MGSMDAAVVSRDKWERSVMSDLDQAAWAAEQSLERIYGMQEDYCELRVLEGTASHEAWESAQSAAVLAFLARLDLADLPALTRDESMHYPLRRAAESMRIITLRKVREALSGEVRDRITAGKSEVQAIAAVGRLYGAALDRMRREEEAAWWWKVRHYTALEILREARAREYDVRHLWRPTSP